MRRHKDRKCWSQPKRFVRLASRWETSSGRVLWFGTKMRQTSNSTKLAAAHWACDCSRLAEMEPITSAEMALGTFLFCVGVQGSPLEGWLFFFFFFTMVLENSCWRPPSLSLCVQIWTHIFRQHWCRLKKSYQSSHGMPVVGCTCYLCKCYVQKSFCKRWQKYLSSSHLWGMYPDKHLTISFGWSMWSLCCTPSFSRQVFW